MKCITFTLVTVNFLDSLHYCLGMPSKKKSSYGRKFAIQGGRGFHQIPSKILKKVGNYYQGRGGPKQYFLFPFPKKNMGNNKDHKSSWIQMPPPKSLFQNFVKYMFCVKFVFCKGRHHKKKPCLRHQFIVYQCTIIY